MPSQDGTTDAEAEPNCGVGHHEGLEGFSPGTGRVRRRAVVAEGRDRIELSGEPATGFAEKLRSGFAVTVEVDLPRGSDISRVVAAARGRG